MTKGVRTFKAASIQAAVQMVKESLGPDAMILSTRRIPKNVRDPYGADHFEVQAAGPDDVAGETSPPKDKEPGTLRPSDRMKTSGDLGSIQHELLGIRDMLAIFGAGDGLPSWIHRHPECLGLYARLVKSGLSERRARYFMRQGEDENDASAPDPGAVNRRVFQALMASFSVADPFLDMARDGDGVRHVAAFVGPTGVGKTTTIAKLAAELSLKQKKKVGLISIDSYRIGALEQLKTYSAIMGLPCLPAFSSGDLAEALKKLGSRDVVLIDTAGHSHFDDQRMKEMADLVGSSEQISTHLVLSATTGMEDMRDAARCFRLLNPQTYVFTKLDETRRRGALLDQMLEMRLPVSFVTNGQRVPEDLIAATRKKVLQMILEDTGK